LIERYVIARRVPELEPPLLHEPLHEKEKMHETMHDEPETEYEEDLKRRRKGAKAQRR
jgi:hypothetical protein